MTSRFKSEPFFFSNRDLQILFQRKKKWYLQIGIVSFVMAFFIVAGLQPAYVSEAKFKKAKSSKDSLFDFKNVLSAMPGASGPSSPVSYLKSRRLLQEVIRDLGLQATVYEQSFLARIGSNIARNVLAECLDFLPIQKEFVFQDLHYDGDVRLDLYVQVLNKEEFVVCDPILKIDKQGSIGSLLTFGTIQFLLSSVPDHFVVDKKYKMSIEPMYKALERVQKKFNVKDDKVDQEVQVLTFSSPSPTGCSLFLDRVMQKYIAYIKDEGYKICREQGDLVGQRKQQIADEYRRFLDEHVSYLEESLGAEGFMGSRQHMAFIEKPNELYHSKLYEVDLELKRLRPSLILDNPDTQEHKRLERKAQARAQDPYDLISSLDTKMAEYLSLQSMKKEGDRSQLMDWDVPEDVDSLSQGEKRLETVLAYLSGSLSSVESLKDRGAHQKNGSSDWMAEIEKEEVICQESSPDIKGRMQIQLDRKKRSLKQAVTSLLYRFHAKKQVLLQEEGGIEYSQKTRGGIDREAIQRLFIDYGREIDAVRLNIQQLTYLKDQIFDPALEISSLGNLLPDSVSQKIIQEATRVGLDLADEGNLSAKEYDRIKGNLFHQKQFLAQHIQQLLEVQKIREKSIQEQIYSLRNETVHLLTIEKQILESRLAELRQKMSGSLPQKWKAENLHLLKKESYFDSLAMLAKVEESKLIEQYMQLSDYKVVDPAFLPNKPQTGKVFVWPSVIFILSCCSFYGIDFFKRAMKGSPVSSELLRYYDLPLMGTMSPMASLSVQELSSQDLESMRKVAHFAFLHKPVVDGIALSLLGCNTPDYSHNLACILAQRGARVLLIDSAFASLSPIGGVGGMFDYLRGEVNEPSIIERGPYNFIYCGGYSKSFVEMLAQNKLKEFVNARKSDYDFVLMYTRAGVLSVEAMIYQSLSDLCIVGTGFDDSIEDLKGFLDWKESKKKECVAFVLSE